MESGYSPEELARVIGGELCCNNHNTLLSVAFDSRLVYDTKGVLFFALTSLHGDGHNYIKELYQKGVSAFVTHHSYNPSIAMQDVTIIKTDDTLSALQKFAAFHRKQFGIPLLAITGSNGKTVVKEWLAQVLDDSENIVKSPRSYNSQIGVPVSLTHINSDSTFALIEAGISEPGEMQRLHKIISPNMGLITNIGQAHQENFDSLQQKLDEKLELFADCELIFYPFDNQLINSSVQRLYPYKMKLSWGRVDGADLQLISSSGDNGRELFLKWRGKKFHITIPFCDSVSVENVLAVILVMLSRGFNFDYISQRIVMLEPVAMRMERKEGVNGSLIINDSYNSDFTSLEVALQFLEQQAEKRKGLRTLILSDMYQTGIENSELYPKIATLIRNHGIDRFIGVGPQMLTYSSHFRSCDTFFYNTEQLLQSLSQLSFKNESVLIKGARKFSFERVSERLEDKKNSTVMEINLDSLINNFNVIRESLSAHTKVLAMVKAFGYGSGLSELAAVLQNNRVDYLGVAFADEGVELRRSGITVPVIVMNPEIKSFEQLLHYNLEPEIYSFSMLEKFSKSVAGQGVKSAKIHVKIDTGMLRLGFYCDEAERVAKEIKKYPFLRVASVFSHLAAADEKRHDEFTRKQIDLFERFSTKLSYELGYKPLMHLLNSAGIERFPQAQYDMVRPGISLYGISSVENRRLHNVVSLKSYISQIKRVEEDMSVGYGRAGLLKAGSSLAVIPAGYADGINRHLSNGKGYVIILGKKAPFVGNICMDMCMVDVTGLAVSEGDEVLFFGDGYPVTEVAKQLDTIPYEVLTGISRRVKRIYFRE
ncbi:bifunctional UDP-N-acetylmuramoyl-tripeptide:D-alanyl-D-alanine ligase/alanine racemase [Marinilabiliaceae bacterium ANBcel2]|nr:bifunctional UDP-N-acetylmuramoyl-tripeptide:D-alanyl-D-alanine ligase/alanine racemase [Marinilabiliaceae bacterium ANBcel2]